jgi:hypothetical protein
MYAAAFINFAEADKSAEVNKSIVYIFKFATANSAPQ